MSDTDKLFVSRGRELGKSLIQIATSNESLIWDIDLEREVSTLANYQQFLSPDTFTFTGHTLFQNNMSNSVSHNQRCDLFCIPGKDGAKDTIIRLTNEYSLRYMIELDKMF